MLTAKSLQKILLPSTISGIEKEKIQNIKHLGQINNYQIRCRRSNPYFGNLGTEYEVTKTIELTNQAHITKNFSNEEKLLYASEIRFPDDVDFIETLRLKKFNKENIDEVNSLIEKCLSSYLQYALALTKIEKSLGLDLERAISIIKIKKQLTDKNYNFNKEDQEIYKTAIHLYNRNKIVETIYKKDLEALNNNETMNQLLLLGEHYYGFTAKYIFLVINKINELMVTCPEKLPSINDKNLLLH